MELHIIVSEKVIYFISSAISYEVSYVSSYANFLQKRLNSLPFFSLHLQQDRASVELVESQACVMVLYPVIVGQQLIQFKVLFADAEDLEGGRNGLDG